MSSFSIVFLNASHFVFYAYQPTFLLLFVWHAFLLILTHVFDADITENYELLCMANNCGVNLVLVLFSYNI